MAPGNGQKGWNFFWGKPHTEHKMTPFIVNHGSRCFRSGSAEGHRPSNNQPISRAEPRRILISKKWFLFFLLYCFSLVSPRSSRSNPTKSPVSGAANRTPRLELSPNFALVSLPSTDTLMIGRTLMDSSFLSYRLSTLMKTKNIVVGRWPLRCFFFQISFHGLLFHCAHFAFFFFFFCSFGILMAFGICLQALHDGKDVFFLLQVDGEYRYSKGLVWIWTDINLFSIMIDLHFSF